MPLRQRFRALSATAKVALIAVLLIGLWLASGALSPTTNPEESATAPEASSGAPGSYRVSALRAEPKKRFVTLYGETAPNRTVLLKSETQGAVREIPRKDGDSVREGDVLIRIDVRDRRERLAKAKALVTQREIEFRAATNLQAKGFQTEVRLAEAKTRLEEAKAELKAIAIDLADTDIKAPFDGVLEEINIEVGDFVGVGVFGGEGAIATLVDLDPLTVTGQLAQRDFPYLDRASKAEVVLTSGASFHGTISFISAVADKASRTFRLEVEIANPEGTIPAGVAAELRVPLAERPAFLVPSSALSLADDGAVGLKFVDAGSTVRFAAVSILEEGEKGVWVAGELPEQLSVITEGQAFLRAGQVLDSVSLNSAPAP